MVKVVQIESSSSAAHRLGVACGDSLDVMAYRAAAANCAVLLTGATGTGKGYLAQWIHEHSSRANGPFVPVNCGAIPESLIDSHLFGHAKGSFSGASADHLGLVRAASGGTILFDEISELPLTAQTRLLRLLEEREVQPVGYSRPMTVDLRIIAATNSDLFEAVQQGRFRADLYFRLDVVRLHLKPLHQRVEEIPRLLACFNAEFAATYRQAELRFDRQAMKCLERYSWPGNIRELRTVVERLHVLRGPCEDSVTVDELRHCGQLRVQPVTNNECSGDRLEMMKLDAVRDVLSGCRGNVSRAATQLGVHRSTLYRWLSNQPVSV